MQRSQSKLEDSSSLDQQGPPSLQKMRELQANLRATMPELGEDNKPGKRGAQRGKGVKSKLPGRDAREAFSPPGLGGAAAGLGTPDFVDSVAPGDMQGKYETLLGEYEMLQADMKKRQESYVRREVQFKAQIERMKELLEKAVLNRGGSDIGMTRIKDLHGRIQEGLGEIKSRTQRVIEEHEKDMLRQFRVRLFDVEDKLKKENSKKDDGSGMPKDWLEKAQKLAKDLDKYREEAVRLDRQNEILMRENSRLKSNNKAQEDDREFLLRQMVGLKKENSRLRKELEKAATSTMRAFLSPAIGSSASVIDSNIGDEEDGGSPPGANSSSISKIKNKDVEISRQQEVIKRLRRLLDHERRNLRDVRAQHVQALASRTELEALLRQALDEVKAEIALRRAESLRPAANIEDDSIPLTREERASVLELLLSKERVLTLLYEKTFPPRSTLAAFGASLLVDDKDDVNRRQTLMDVFPELREMEAMREEDVE